MTLKYDKSLEQIGRQYNCMAKHSNVTGPKTRQSDSKMMFPSQMMKIYGILSPSSERDNISIEGFFFLDEEPNDDSKTSPL